MTPRFLAATTTACAVLAAAAWGQAPAGTKAPAGFPGLAGLVTRAEKQGLRTGVVVLDLRRGEVRFRHRATEAFLPASNQKLVTAAAALWELGGGFRFRTVFALVDGVLVVRAAGDPNWQAGGAHDPAFVFQQVAARLKKAGIQSVRGIRLDPGRFVGPSRPTGWPKNQYHRTYCAPTAGLILEAGCFVARISPGLHRAKIDLIAPPAEAVFGGGIEMTTKRKKRYSYWVSQSGEQFKGQGEFSVRAKPVKVRGVCQEPEWLFESALRTVLTREGIQITADAEASNAQVLTWESSLREALIPMLKDSSNFHAEQVLRTVGSKRGDGSFAGGRKAVRAIVGARVVIPEAVRIADGSGLSRDDRTTPQVLADVLRELLRGEHAKLVVDSLARGGVDGTLRRRFRRNKALGRAVRAKTGTIRGVKTLSGLVQRPDGRVFVFSILMNANKGKSTRGASALQEEMVQVIYKSQ